MKPQEEGGLVAIASHRCLVIAELGSKPMHSRDLAFSCSLTYMMSVDMRCR